MLTKMFKPVFYIIKRGSIELDTISSCNNGNKKRVDSRNNTIIENIYYNQIENCQMTLELTYIRRLSLKKHFIGNKKKYLKLVRTLT